MMKKHFQRTLILAVLSLFAWLSTNGFSALAQDVETREVTVTSTRVERDIFEIPMTVGVKTEEDLKRQPATTIADFLSDIPGVEIADGGMPGGKRVLIRGESSTRSVILIDGVRISEQKSMSGPAILMDPSQIERVELIKGPASVLYGSEAIAGVVNIITKKGGRKPFSFSQVLVADSSNDSLNVQSSIFGSASGFNYRFSGSGQNAGLRSTPRGSLENSKYKYRSYSGRLGYDWDGGSVYVRAEDYQSTIHIPTNVSSGYIVSPQNIANILANTTNVILDLPKWDRRTFGAGLELNDPVPRMVKFKLDLYHQNMKKDFFNTILMRNFTVPSMAETIQRMPMHTYNDQDSFGGVLQTDWRLGDHYVIFGLDYNKDKLDADDEREGTFVTIVNSGLYMPGIPSAFKYTAEQSMIGLFLQDEWKLPSDFTATLGARNTWVKSSMGPHDNPDLPHPPDSSDSKLVGNVGLVYTGFDNFALRASWAQGYKFPPLNDLYMGTVHGSSNPTLPNPDLKPETSNNLELGLRYNNGALSLDFAAFYSMAKNYITTRPSTVPATGAAATQFFNSDEATTMGFELGASYDIDSLGLTPYASVAYISRETKDNITVRSRFPLATLGTRRQEVLETKNTGTPPFAGRLGLRFDKDLDDSFIFHSDAYMETASKARQTYFDTTGAHDVNGTGILADYDYDFATDEYPGWTTFNVTVGLEWGEEHKWNAALAVRNIFDREYFRANNANMDPGFNIMASLGFEY